MKAIFSIGGFSLQKNNQGYFINERFKTNQKLNAAKYCINALMFNHVISVIDAVWSSQRNVKKDNQTNIKTQFNLVYNPYNNSGVGGLKFSLFF